MTGLGDAWADALSGNAPHASWCVAEDGRVLAAHEPERWFSSASMIKTFLAAVAFDGLDLAAPLRVRADHRTGGDGVLGTFESEVELPVLELLRLMLAISDNTATRVVLEAAGGPEAVNARLAEWGYGSRVRAGTTDLPTPVGLGMTSVAEHQRLMGELPEPALKLLAQQQDRWMLARHVGEDVWFAHKTGSIGGVRHDAGVLRAGSREIAVGCFTDGGPHQEWPDHPACVAMGRAMLRTAELLELDIGAP